MVKQKKRTRIMQSGKNCAINCAIQAAYLIWKQKISLVLTKLYCSLFNHNPEFRCVICTLLHFLHYCITHFALALHSFLSQSELNTFFVYITMYEISAFKFVNNLWFAFFIRKSALYKFIFVSTAQQITTQHTETNKFILGGLSENQPEHATSIYMTVSITVCWWV